MKLKIEKKKAISDQSKLTKMFTDRNNSTSGTNQIYKIISIFFLTKRKKKLVKSRFFKCTKFPVYLSSATNTFTRVNFLSYFNQDSYGQHQSCFG